MIDWVCAAAGYTPTGALTNPRNAFATAEATAPGICAPACGSKWIQPSPSAGNRPRTRPTSNAVVLTAVDGPVVGRLPENEFIALKVHRRTDDQRMSLVEPVTRLSKSWSTMKA